MSPVVAEIRSSSNLILLYCKTILLSATSDCRDNEDENPSIGIVLCKSKNETIVEYALRGAVQPLGVATYRAHGELPADLQRELPLPDQIARLMESID